MIDFHRRPTLTLSPALEEIQKAREERRTTGRVVAVIVALSLILLACYHAWIRKTAVLAGVIIPALIMVLYTAWVLYSARRDKYRRNLEACNGAVFLSDVFSIRDPVHSNRIIQMPTNIPKHRRRRKHKRPEIVKSQLYRNVFIQEIPPFSGKSAISQGDNGRKSSPSPEITKIRYRRHSFYF